MSKISSDDTKKVAKLANLPISPQEEKIFTDQLSKVLDYVDQLDKINVSADPTFNVTQLKNNLREDQEKESLSREDALVNSPQKADKLFKTKGVFNE